MFPLAIGGYNGIERLNTVEVLDGSKKAWSRVASMNCRRSAVGAAALSDHLYVIYFIIFVKQLV